MNESTIFLLSPSSCEEHDHASKDCDEQYVSTFCTRLAAYIDVASLSQALVAGLWLEKSMGKYTDAFCRFALTKRYISILRYTNCGK